MTESQDTRGPGRKFIIAGLVVAACIAGLVMVSTEGLDFYSSVADFHKKLDTYRGATVRVRGIIQAGSVRHDAKMLETEFVLREEDASLKTEAVLRVFYQGNLPDNFEAGKDIVAQGTYDASRKLFVANQLMFKCPSKYESKKQGTGRPTAIMK